MMHTRADKSQENKSRASANQLSRKEDGSQAAFQLTDNSSEAIQLRKLQLMEDNSPQAANAARLQAMADKSPYSVAQRKLIEGFAGGALQKQDALEEDELQMKAGPRVFQRQGMEEEDLQMKAGLGVLQRRSTEEEELLQGKVEPFQQKENKTGLPDKLKDGVENLSGLSMDDVKVHYNSAKPATLQALAYTQGTDIHVGPGQEQHLPHEAWHVAQQKQGRVKPTMRMAGIEINDDAELEKEADSIGSKAMQMYAKVEKPRENVINTRIVQYAGHRPDESMQINYVGQVWTVRQSNRDSDFIRIFRAPNKTQNINWRISDFTILRANTNQDFDMRLPEDEYSTSVFKKNVESRGRFKAARLQALTMIKNIAQPSIGQAYVDGFNGLTLDDFEVAQKGPTLSGAGKVEEAAEWECIWIEGNQERPRRRWKLVIDSDNPEPESSQEPHVGWEVSAESGQEQSVNRTLGHIWLDFVPVARGVL